MNSEDTNGLTALMNALQYGRSNVVILIVDHKIKIIREKLDSKKPAYESPI